MYRCHCLEVNVWLVACSLSHFTSISLNTIMIVYLLCRNPEYIRHRLHRFGEKHTLITSPMYGYPLLDMHVSIPSYYITLNCLFCSHMFGAAIMIRQVINQTGLKYIELVLFLQELETVLTVLPRETVSSVVVNPDSWSPFIYVIDIILLLITGIHTNIFLLFCCSNDIVMRYSRSICSNDHQTFF